MSLARAIETGDLAQLPSRRDEDWHWTDLRGLIREAPKPSPAYDGLLPDGPFEGLADAVLANVNGRGHDRLVVAPGMSETVALRIVALQARGHAATIEIVVGEGASLTLLESYEGDDRDYLRETDLTIRLAPRASMERIVLAADGDEAVSVSRAEVSLSAGSHFAQTVIASGARRQRLETRVAHPGAHATVRMDGLYILAGRRHADITTIVTHEGVDGATDQLVKGVVADQARGIFQGRIVVREGADQTDARMGHHALILSDRAEVDAKPELEIYADDVACAHGNTVGALDEEALFYAEQRGIPEAQARAMLTEAFVSEVTDRIDHAGAREAVRAWVAARLGAQS